MNVMLFLIIATVLGIVYVILGLRAAKNVKTDSDYFVAGRTLGVAQITCNLIATQLGGGMLLGTAASAYALGYYGILYTLGMCIGFFMLALGIASRLQQFPVTTTAQLFETQYNSVTLKKIASLLSIATFFGILIAQVVGFKGLLAGVGITNTLFVALFWLSVVAYTMIGGLRAITINDMVQLAIITLVFTGVFLYTMFQDTTPWFSLTSLKNNQLLFDTTAVSYKELAGIILMPALFSLFQQDLAQRFFASRSKAVATMSAANAALFLLLFSLIPVYFGMKARMLTMALGDANPLIAVLAQYTNDVVFALVLCAIIAAIISTSDALMNAVSANITQDFNIATTLRFKNKLAVSKMVTLVVGSSALIASYFVPGDIIGIIIGSYELSVSCLLVPLLVCYYKKKVYTSAAWGSIVAGLAGFFFFRWYPVPVIPKEIMAIACSGAGYLIGSWVASQKSG